jgi:hypothetical protein
MTGFMDDVMNISLPVLEKSLSLECLTSASIREGEFDDASNCSVK